MTEYELPELQAFSAECEAVEATFAQVDDVPWSAPALGEWSVAELTGHLIGGAGRLAENAETDPGGDEPVVDRVSYFQFDLTAEAPAIAERARQRARSTPTSELPAAFARAWPATTAVVTARGPDALIATLRGPMRIREYLATRVLEVTVHHMDLRAALGLPPVPTVAAARMTMALLEGLLDGARPRNLGRARFIKVATGRMEHDDPRFPVLR